MLIRFDKIEIEGFFSIGNSCCVELNGKGLTLVQGKNKYLNDNAKSNGSGKSSIFEAIFWTLTGTTMRGTKDVVNANYYNGCSCNLYFTYNNDEIVLMRTREHKEFGTNLKIYRNGDDISGKGLRESEKILESVIDINSNILSSIIILGQGMPNKLTSLSSSNRKILIETLTNLSGLFDDLSHRISRNKASTIGKTNSAMLELKGLETELRLNTDALTRAEQSAALTKKIVDIELEINRLNNTLIGLENEYNRECFIYDKLIELQYEGRQNNSNLLVNITSEKNNIALLQTELGAMESHTCPTCGAELSKNKLDDNLARASEINRLLILAQSVLATKENTLSDLAQNMELVGAQVAQSNQNKILLTQQIYETKLNKDKLSVDKAGATLADQEINRINLAIETTNESIKEVSDNIQNLDISTKAINKISSLVSKEFRGYMIDGAIQLINSCLEYYSDKLFSKGYLSIALEGNTIAIQADGRPYENKSGGEKQKIDIAIQLALRKMMMKLSGFSCNILVLDEVFDGLDSKGCELLLEVLTDDFTDLESMFVITHHSDISIPYDNKITICKEINNISTIRDY